MTIDGFPTSTSSQGAFPKPFPACKALPTTSSQSMGEKTRATTEGPVKPHSALE